MSTENPYAPKVTPDPLGRYDYAGLRPHHVKWGEDDSQFRAVRRELDRAMQVCRETPVQRQEGQDVAAYRRALVEHLQHHCADPMLKKLDFRRLPQEVWESRGYEKMIVQDALREPHRMGELREIKSMEQSGRVTSEFVGVKSWMAPFKAPAYECSAIGNVPVRALFG